MPTDRSQSGKVWRSFMEFLHSDDPLQAREGCSSTMIHEALDVSCPASRPDRREDRHLRPASRLEHLDGPQVAADRPGLPAAVPADARKRLAVAGDRGPRLPRPQGRTARPGLGGLRCRAPPPPERANPPRGSDRAGSGSSISKVTDDMTISTSRAAEKPSRQLDAPVPMATSALLGLLRRLPAPLADLHAPGDQDVLTLATRRGAIRLLLGLAGEVIVARARG